MNPDKFLKFTPGSNDFGKRADRVIRIFLHECPISALYGGFRKKDIRINGEKTEPSRKIAPGDTIFVSRFFARRWNIGTMTDQPNVPPENMHRSAVTMPAEILLETQDLLALNKPAGMLTHGEESLETAVREYLEPKLPPSLSFTPGPLHRLDRNTSGVVFFGKSIEGARRFSALVHDRSLKKRYAALAEGSLAEKSEWKDTVNRDFRRRTSTVSESPAGRSASLEVEPIARDGRFSLLLFTLHTGRTHQIRIQSASRGLPLAGDIKYGGRRFGHLPLPSSAGMPPYLLHALEVAPINKDFVENAGFASVTAQFPPYFLRTVTLLFGENTAVQIEQLASSTTIKR